MIWNIRLKQMNSDQHKYYQWTASTASTALTALTTFQVSGSTEYTENEHPGKNSGKINLKKFSCQFWIFFVHATFHNSIQK